MLCSIVRRKKVTNVTNVGAVSVGYCLSRTISFDSKTTTIGREIEHIPCYQALTCCFAERRRTL